MRIFIRNVLDLILVCYLKMSSLIILIIIHVNVQVLLLSDSIERVSESPDCPSPPPRRNRNRKYEERDSSSPGFDQDHLRGKGLVGLDLSADDNHLRSPSLRKRDAMMRRYNSTSALPISAPMVDMNKNHINPARDKLSLNGADRKDWGSTYHEPSDPQNSGHELNGKQTQDLCQVDIVGESFEARFPWQRDISTQCDISGERCSISSSCSGSGGSDGSYQSQNLQNCSNYVNDERNVNFRRSSNDSVRRRHNVFKNRRPRSMTSLESHLRNSDIYRSDTNINYSGRQGRTCSDPTGVNPSNRKRMPLLVADDPGSVSDLESIMENPNDR